MCVCVWGVCGCVGCVDVWVCVWVWMCVCVDVGVDVCVDGCVCVWVGADVWVCARARVCVRVFTARYLSLIKITIKLWQCHGLSD